MLLKKNRNNILKRGTASYCKRHLTYEEYVIEWGHFRKAYLWDLSANPLSNTP